MGASFTGHLAPSLAHSRQGGHCSSAITSAADKDAAVEDTVARDAVTAPTAEATAAA